MITKMRGTSQAALLGATLLIALILASFSALSRNSSAAHPGDLDPTFGTGGKVITNLGASNSTDRVNALAVQGDAKIVVIGDSDFTLVRYNGDGTLDTSFGLGGKVITENIGTAAEVAIQSDGKIVLAGTNGYSFVLARYNTNGSLDMSFDNDGIVVTLITFRDAATALAIQNDGKIVAAGHTGVEYPESDFALVRYNANGSLDDSFGNGGIVTTTVGNISVATSLALQSDGKIVAAGYSWLTWNDYDFALARYNADGSLDTTFSDDGKVITPISGGLDYINSVALQGDGKIVVAGNGYGDGGDSDFVLARYNTDGSLDSSFDGDGKVLTDFDNYDDSARGVVIQGDGKIVAAGFKSGTSYYDFALARYNLDGTLDISFDGDGKVTTPITMIDYDAAYAIALQADGKIIAAGYKVVVSDTDFALTRYNTNGSLDTSFGGDGIVLTNIGNRNDVANSVALQADGKIIVAGMSSTRLTGEFALVRYNPDGSLDTSFGTDGIVTTVFGTDYAEVTAVVVVSDGKIVAVGTSWYDNNSKVALARYNPDGSLDLGFGSNGKIVTAIGGGRRAVAIQPDGKIVVAGFDNSFTLVRYNTNGTLDTSFDGDGIATTTFGNGFYHSASVAIQTDGKIVAGGMGGTEFDLNFALARYNADGTLDVSFGAGGKVLTDTGNSADLGGYVATQSDGKIVLAGFSFSSGNYGYDNVLVRYNTNGTLDPTFDGDGIAITYTLENDSVNSIALQGDGKILAAGYRQLPSDSFGLALARYNTDGSLDTGFGVGGFSVTSVDDHYQGPTALAIQNDHKIVLVGTINNNAVMKSDFALLRYEGGISSAPASHRLLDFDGDGKADLSVFRPAEATWFIERSSGGGLIAQQWGLSTDKLAPADYDGDGKTEVAIFRDGVWYQLNLSNNVFAVTQFGQAGDIPVPADYDGDGKADLAVYRQGIWYIKQSSLGFAVVQFGSPTDKPVAADYDGDGKVDPAVYRDGTWYLLRSTEGFTAVQFGLSTDRPVTADYDGDSKSDVAVYRDGRWYILGSGTGFRAVNFGLSTDIPVPADYDGDSKADIAVFRNGTWYMRRSSDGVFEFFYWGTTGDVPLESVYVP